MALEPAPASPLPPRPGAGEVPDRAALSSAARSRTRESSAPPDRTLTSSATGDAVSAPGPAAPGPGALDALLAVFVCALALLLASTPARNSDLWLHLASGRLLARGRPPWGTDPFASTTAGVFWVNHSWL